MFAFRISFFFFFGALFPCVSDPPSRALRLSALDSPRKYYVGHNIIHDSSLCKSRSFVLCKLEIKTYVGVCSR